MARHEKIFDKDADRIFENLKERMDRSSDNDLLPVIILYKEKTPLAGTFAARLNHIKAERIKHSYRNIPAVSVSMTRKQIEEASRDPWVEHIEYDARVRAAMNTARSSFGVDSVRKQFGFTGDGDNITGNYSRNDIVIAILDTGIDDKHPDLKGKVLFWKDFIGSAATPYDNNGHGSSVAAVAVGAGKKNKKYTGVAPDAALVVFKVLDNAGSGDVSGVIAAIDEVIARKNEFNIRALNLSLAVAGTSNGKDALSVAANRAVGSGIVVVAAAGNEGPGSHTIGSPSAAAKVITVGAGADPGERGFYLASFSSRGPTQDGRKKPDLWAPGVRITTFDNGRRFTSSGTSLATPFVTGVVALMLEANPALSPRKVKKILLGSAEKWAPGAKSNESGKGRLQAYDAIARAAAIRDGLNPPDVPSVSFVQSSISSGAVNAHSFTISSIKNFIAVTAAVFDEGTGVRLELVAPGGNVVAQTSGFSRHQQISFKPSVAGIYVVRVTGIGGSSQYLLDVSADQD